MKLSIGCVALLAAVTLAAPRPASADDMSGAAGLQRDVVTNMMDAGTKLMELTGAIPEKKFSYRPGKGVRSVNEVCLHVVGANYMIPGLLGASTGKSMEEAMGLEKTTPGKDKIEQMLKESYEVASKAVAGVADSDLETQVDFFGSKMSKRQVMLVLAAHSHEHLGQMIAYARVNGITPPWTARDQAAAKKAAAEKKSNGGM